MKPSTKEPKQKRSRVSAPKVRTGCLTCKTRHLKCDEEKPICRRCRSDGFQCDGYLQPLDIPSSRKKSKKTYSPPSRPLVGSTNIGNSDSEKRFFHHFRESTVKDLASGMHRTPFWYDVVLPSAHGNDSVRHALVALGAAHWLFLNRHSTASSLVDTSKLEHLILQQYTQSITHLTSTMARNHQSESHLTLICCLIFFCIENVNGKYAAALRHLRAGSRMLIASGQSPSSSDSSPKSSSSSQNHDAVCEIADMFAQLGTDTSLFLDGPTIPDLTPYSRAIAEVRSPSQAFISLTDARNRLRILELDFNQELAKYQDDADAPELRHIYDRIRWWAFCFDNLEVSLSGSTLCQSDQQEFLALKLSRAVWMNVINTTGDSVDETALNEILNFAEDLIRSFASQSYPIFTLHADLVPALTLVCDTSDNVRTQRRAISLLRSMHRREGLWDSHEVAEYLENSLMARNLLQDEWDNVIGGIPGGARCLADINLSTLTPDNGILQMANQLRV